jgi:hypothetical protein
MNYIVKNWSRGHRR